MNLKEKIAKQLVDKGYIKTASNINEELRDAIYKAISNVSFNNGNVINFSREDLQWAFDECIEKWFEHENEEKVDDEIGMH